MSTVWNWSGKILFWYGLFRPCLKSFVALNLLNRLRLPLPYANPKPKPSDIHAKSYPHRGTRGGGLMEPPLSFLYVAVFRNDFATSGKPLTFSRRQGILYGWWRCWRSVRSSSMVAILDFIRN